ncbi:MAG: BON domain-containing protein [Acidobacteria bacterium]|nr:BON domain-containing protein [Acidobacteriota bacterium]
MKFSALFLSLAVVIVSVGCEMGANTNVNVNANSRNANSNRTNAATPVATATPAASNSNVNRADYDKNRAEYEKDKGSSTIGQGVNDSWIWFKTKTALAAADGLRDSTINVDVVNDVITLKGTVATAAQKTAAEAVAKSIEGQKGVKNQLTVKANDSMTNQMVNGNTKGVSNTNKK